MFEQCSRVKYPFDFQYVYLVELSRSTAIQLLPLQVYVTPAVVVGSEAKNNFFSSMTIFEGAALVIFLGE